MKLSHKQKYRLLGLNIAYYRKLNGYTQEGLAEKLDIDRTTVSKIELANAGVSLDIIFDIADLFEIPVEKLFVFRWIGTDVKQKYRVKQILHPVF